MSASKAAGHPKEAEQSDSKTDTVMHDHAATANAYTDPDVLPLWAPDPSVNTPTRAFLEALNARLTPKETPLRTYEELWRRSCAHPAEFWGLVWDFVDVVGERGARKRKRALDAGEDRVGDRGVTQSNVEVSTDGLVDGSEEYGDSYADVVDENATPADNPRWFTSARVNWAENMLPARVRSGEAGSRTALVQVIEPLADEKFDPSALKRVSYSELYTLVADLVSALLSLGLQPGDRVGAYCSNCVENIAACLATSAIGCIWTSAAADFGPEGVLERFEQVRPKIVFSVNGVVYNGKVHPHLPKLGSLLDGLASRGCVPLKVVVVNTVPALPFGPGGSTESRTHWRTDWVTWDTFVAEGSVSKLGRDASGEILWKRLDFNWPLWILFSSGTTGKPKPIVHRAGGMLLQARKEFAICGDLRPEDMFFYYTTTGWMMWNFLVAGLASGCTLVLYDGSPLRDPSLLWELVDVLGITIFGTSAKYLDELSKVYKPREHHNLSTLKHIYSTGSPLAPTSFDYVYQHIKPNVLLGSITGGTDICSLFAGMNSSLPVYRGEIQCRMLGMAIEVYTPGGKACAPGSGRSGELTLTPPLLRLLKGDIKHHISPNSRIHDHGDHVLLTPSRRGNGGGLVMLGRSDGVLNPGGVRFGSAEIYDVVEHCFKVGSDDSGAPREHVVIDCLAVGQAIRAGADERVVLFVKLAEGCSLNDKLASLIRAEIRKRRSARHVPEKVTDIPYTLNGKRVEVPIKKIINGAPVGEVNRATLRNPDCLEEYVVLGEELRREVQ